MIFEENTNISVNIKSGVTVPLPRLRETLSMTLYLSGMYYNRGNTVVGEMSEAVHTTITA